MNQAIANQKTRPKNVAIYVVWMFSPMIALLNAILHYRAAYAKNVLWLFIIFYGFTFVVSNEQLDSNRYRRSLVQLANQPITNFNDFTALLYSEETDYVDILQPLVTFLVSRLTSDSRILFAVFGFIYGYFYSRNVAFLIQHIRGRINKDALPFLLLFVFIVAIWQINGFRFYTAAQVFVFGIFHYFNGKKIKGLLFAAGSLLVHFSFALPLAIFLLYMIVGNRLVICLALFFASFFVSQVTPEFLREYSNSLPAVFQERTSKYTSELYLKVRKKEAEKGANWYVTARITGLLYLTGLLLAYCYFFVRKPLQQNVLALSTLCFGLMLFSVSNILTSVPSVGIRFQLISMLIVFSSFFFLFQSLPKGFLPLFIKAPVIIVALLFIIVEVRIGFDTMGLMTVIGNPFVAPFVDGDIPLIDLVK